VDHPWLDDKDRRGRKRERYEKELIVTGLMHNGPQPRTRDDRVWRKADKLQRYSDVFVTGAPQSELIRGEWSGHPIVPPGDPLGQAAGGPARFGRRVRDRYGPSRTEKSDYDKPVFERLVQFVDPALPTEEEIKAFEETKQGRKNLETIENWKANEANKLFAEQDPEYPGLMRATPFPGSEDIEWRIRLQGRVK
jgi:hypothetical protein